MQMEEARALPLRWRITLWQNGGHQGKKPRLWSQRKQAAG
jgi:hypothetical protein